MTRNTPFDAVRAFADNALEKGRDRWSGEHTPLFADGVHVDSGKPVEWLHQGSKYVVSNTASQQNFLRTLTGLSRLTGDESYEQAAKETVAYMFEHYRAPCGLLYWGGHTFIDLHTLDVVPIEEQSMIEPESGKHMRTHPYGGMEIKMHLPFYELMFEVDFEATRRFIRAYWNADLMDWRRLELNRHAPYNKKMGDLWDSPWDDPEPFFETTGHASTMPLTDLSWAAVMLHKATGGKERSLPWARRIASMLRKARHPQTGLGAAKFTFLKKQKEIPEELKGTRQSTFSQYGDRMRNRFGAEFGDTAREAWALWTEVKVRRLYCEYALGQMANFKQLDGAVSEFLEWAVEGLRAWARHAYVPEHNHFRALWADGTDMTGYVDRGFHGYGARGEIKPIPADGTYLLPFARAWRLSGDEELWKTVISMLGGNNLVDFSGTRDKTFAVPAQTACDDPFVLFALLELYQGSGEGIFLELAGRIGDNMIEKRFINNLFPTGPDHCFARFDALEPLALLHLEEARGRQLASVPDFVGGCWRYLQGPYDGQGRSTDQKLFYAPGAFFRCNSKP